ncbi:AAA family ATPase [Actinomadura sp. 9N407]|uniref:helix-turn-helix transcriptional regulator n=1 Tax=Actinomadura sp. 9N407 TaxID=3375154 RepID=UPI00379E6B06
MAVEELMRGRCGRARSVPVPPPGTTGDLPLRGREPEVGLLLERFTALAEGEGGVVVVEGPPGSGRTRLLAETRAGALAAGLSCRHGAGVPGGFPVPFGPLLEALYTGPVALPDASALRTVGGADLRSWTLREVRNRLVDSAEQGPLVVWLDDVQWCDPVTLAALPALLDDLADFPLLWVLAMWPVRADASGPISALRRIRERGGHRIVLGPLADGAVAALATDVLKAEPDDTVMRAARRAQGTPRLVVELLRGMREDGLITIRDGVASAAGETIPRRLDAMVRGRLDRLSPAGRRGLQVASVLGRPFTPAELRGLTGATAEEITAVTDEAVGAGFLSGTGTFLAFRHDLVRQAISETLPAALRRTLRRQAVDVHLAQGGRAADVAALLAETAVPGDHQAVDLLREVATGLAATAPTEAVALSRRALELAGPAGPHTAEIVGETVELLGRTGRYAEARALADTALEGVLAPEAEARLRLRVARLSGHSSFAEAVRQCRIGLSLPGLPQALRAGLSAVQALHLSHMGEAEQAIAAAGRLAEGSDDAAATALAALSRVELSRLNLDLAFELQERADSLTTDSLTTGSRTPQPPWPEACGRAFLLTASGQVRAALKETDAGVRTARRTGDAATASLWSMSRARILLDAGRLAAARTEADAALASAGELGSGDFADTTARYAFGRAAVQLGDREGIRRCAADGAEMMGAEAPVVRRTGAWLAALAADAMGDTARVAEVIKLAWVGEGALDPSPGVPPDPADHVVLARLALRAGLPGLAAAAKDRAADLDPGFPFLRGVAVHTRGIVDGDPDLLLHAVKLLEDAERPLIHASAAEDAGRALGSHGDPAARGLLATALDLYEESNAARDAARVRRRLRLLGVRRTDRTGDSAREGQWGLTAAEARVARLVAQGATNPQVAEQLFVSRHTVNTHLRRIFAKWDINSRVDLARLVLAHEAVSPPSTGT